jgi:hypothetical protein
MGGVGGRGGDFSIDFDPITEVSLHFFMKKVITRHKGFFFMYNSRSMTRLDRLLVIVIKFS